MGTVCGTLWQYFYIQFKLEQSPYYVSVLPADRQAVWSECWWRSRPGRWDSDSSRASRGWQAKQEQFRRSVSRDTWSIRTGQQTNLRSLHGSGFEFWRWSHICRALSRSWQRGDVSSLGLVCSDSEVSDGQGEGVEKKLLGASLPSGASASGLHQDWLQLRTVERVSLRPNCLCVDKLKQVVDFSPCQS